MDPIYPDPIYLDHMASTPLDPAVLDEMLPWMSPGGAGNPHSAGHRAGWHAAEAIERARGEVAALIGARPGEILFTSGATEANCLALLGGVPEGWPVAASAVEHPGVLACVAELARRGHTVRLLPVDGAGRVDPGALEGRGPALVSVMAANNEVGTIQPVGHLARRCREAGGLFHTDAVQRLATGKIDVAALGIDLLSLSGHKLYGPMGIGALFVRQGVALRPLLFGGGQQGGRRPGTLPTALCVGLGAACRIARERREADALRLAGLRERLFAALAAGLPGLRRNGPAGDGGLPGCLHVTIPGADAADRLLDLPGLALSTGSACASGEGGPSHVLLAMGRSAEEAFGSIRIGVGRFTTEDEVDRAAALLVEAFGGVPGGTQPRGS
ncbi:cysteine desulfurase [Skermanella mucosa]|uniref:cysteine desulfurase family protein n=1 Tax=Skermanella mucosa TaxID=1789672 RepID=UPI001E3468C7|nr:cysteine desulfurase family protein [Skermanella mucosa]UEM18432.1 cysteine desulfurase [Skermanella mucosa]